MSQKSSVPQAVSFVSRVLKRDTYLLDFFLRWTCPVGSRLAGRLTFLNMPFVAREAVKGAKVRKGLKPWCSAN